MSPQPPRVDRPDVTTAPRPDVSPPQPWALPPIQTQAAPSGPTVHLLDLPGRELVAVAVLVDAPVTAEELAKAGVGTIAARALDEGTENHDGDSFAAALDRIGADWSPRVSFGGTRVTVTVPTEHLEAGLDLLREALLTPTFPARDVARLVGQRRDRLAQELATPAGKANLALRRAAVAPDHRASLPGAGDDATMAALTRDDVVAHHRDVVVGAPVDVVVAGDLSGVDVVALVERHLGELGPATLPPTRPDPLRLQSGPRIVVVDQPGAVQTELRVVRAGPDTHADDRAPTRLLAHVLGGPLTSRLDGVLREERGFTYGVRSSLQTFRRGGLFVLASGSFDTPTTAESLRIIRDVASTLGAQGPTDAEVAGAADYLAGVIPLSLETPQALAATVAGNLGDDLPPGHTTEHLARLRSATPDEVRAAAHDHLLTDDVVVVAVGDAAAIADDLAALDWGEVDLQPAT
ncbi:M16 family metallopeptidase [Salsipaludibacter albus]|uniref:M16 family metallopeptidase n=1 Tax=Salsipaludibacter albus TaxID=2849650 RepID=UPI001EE48366|nr:pitrilysin family protein [Salsipaludibacter albus]MBY5160950.1 insulinase family protein [Salsipaludibacter albus]